jgi:hypothetical protein
MKTKKLPWILCALLLTGCDQKKAELPAPVLPAAQPSLQSTVPTSATQLYQLLGPVALFPDNLLAQVLAAANYPDQIAAASSWLAQNSTLKGAALQQAVNQQPWDTSVKGLIAFPDVLSQMAQNLAWTRALAMAYTQEPGDVMNAVQILRQRATNSGALKSSAQQQVDIQPNANASSASASVTKVVPAPTQTIVIKPAQPSVVYVPTYNPSVVYGYPAVPVYPGYVPPPTYSSGDMLATGLISFGVGVAVGSLVNDHWDDWGVGWHQSTVVYHNSPYVIHHTTTIINNHNTRWSQPQRVVSEPHFAPVHHDFEQPHFAPSRSNFTPRPRVENELPHNRQPAHIATRPQFAPGPVRMQHLEPRMQPQQAGNVATRFAGKHADIGRGLTSSHLLDNVTRRYRSL